MSSITVVLSVGLLILLQASGVGYGREAGINETFAAPQVAGPKEDSGQQPTSDSARSAIELERCVIGVYERVSPAVVRWSDSEMARSSLSGVIVSPEGLVLLAGTAKRRKLTFQLCDGRFIQGTALGWSDASDVGMARLEGSGKWPCVKLGATTVRAGQRVITVGYASSEPSSLFSRPFLGMGRVTASAVDHWFMVSDVSTNSWRYPALVFDLDGNLAGFGWTLYEGEQASYTRANKLSALWHRLVKGENLDLVRLDSARGRNEEEAEGQRLSAGGIAGASEVVERKAKAATIRIRRRMEDRGCSGVIISPEGLIATCAHHLWLPGTPVIISLPDGRDVTGKVVGVNRVCDIGLARINEAGPWPYVPRGNSTRLKAGDACLSIGYGPVEIVDRQPSVRRSTIAALSSDVREYRLGTNPSTELVGGDSGGGVFDMEGRLVAIHQQPAGVGPGGKQHPNYHPRVELFQWYWDQLNALFERRSDLPLLGEEVELGSVTASALKSVVEVLDGYRIVALGVIISRNGLILTKASDLPEAPICRFSDGRMLPASLVKMTDENDLATLKVDALDLPTAEWSEMAETRVGTILAIPTRDRAVVSGFLSHPPVSIPAEPGALWVRLQDGVMGVEVVQVLDDFGMPTLRKGDIVRSIDGHQIRDIQDYRKLCDPEHGQLHWTAGGRPSVLVSREGTVVALRPRTGPRALPRSSDEQSARSSGFGLACAVTMDSRPLLGGPVINRSGKVAGLAIAWRARGCLLVLDPTIARRAAMDAGGESDSAPEAKQK